MGLAGNFCKSIKTKHENTQKNQSQQKQQKQQNLIETFFKKTTKRS